MIRTKLLAAAASVAFIASGVAAGAQDAEKHAPAAAERAEPRAGAAMHEQGAPPAVRAEGPQNEMKGSERPRAAEAPAQEHKSGENRAAEQGQTPAARTGANERPAAAKTGAAENENRAADQNRTGAAERDRNAPRTGANEVNRPKERMGATESKTESNRPDERTGAAEPNRTGARTADQTGQHGPAQVRGNVHMSSEHATRVGESLRRDMRPERVGIDVRVGERVPERIRIRPLPEDVIAIVPEYRGYDYFIDENDEIVFVSPQSHEIVGMIAYEGRAASEDATHVRAARPCPPED